LGTPQLQESGRELVILVIKVASPDALVINQALSAYNRRTTLPT
jgi:hypothetical protein